MKQFTPTGWVRANVLHYVNAHHPEIPITSRSLVHSGSGFAIVPRVSVGFDLISCRLDRDRHNIAMDTGDELTISKFRHAKAGIYDETQFNQYTIQNVEIKYGRLTQSRHGTIITFDTLTFSEAFRLICERIKRQSL